MKATGLIPLFIGVLLILLYVFLLKKIFKIQIEPVKYITLDGLRGYLAIFVFIHHSCVYYFYLKTGRWQIPTSNLYTHLGHSSVSVFFMITGFLFFRKLIESDSINWIRFYIFRILRLVPVYLFSVFILVLISFFISGFIIREPFIKLIKEILVWSTFTIVGFDDINGVKDTNLIMAGVTWSLAYEWLFYFCLPFCSLIFLKFKTDKFILLFALLVIIIIIYYASPLLIHIWSFLGGIIAAFVYNSKKTTLFLINKYWSLVFFFPILIAGYFFSDTYNLSVIILISIAFTIIACGNILFGFLIHPVSRILGKLTYCIYLFHGIFLFVTFKIIVGYERAKTFSGNEHWLVIFAISLPLIFFSYFVHIFIETPFIKNSQNIYNKVTSFLVISNFKFYSFLKSNNKRL